MTPILSQLLCDNETLLDYIRGRAYWRSVTMQEVCRRLVALERKKDPSQLDAYYEGLGQQYLSEYRSFAQLMWKLPYLLANDYLCRAEGQIFVNAEGFDQWMNLICQFPPSLLVAAFFLDRFSEEDLKDKRSIHKFSKENFEQFKYTAQVIPYLPDLAFFVRQGKRLNDLHIHLNGSTEVDVLWNYILAHPHPTMRNFIELYRTRESIRKQAEQLFPGFKPLFLQERIREAIKLRKRLRKAVDTDGYFATVMELDRSITEMNKEQLLYIAIMNKLRKTDNEELAHLFHHYLLIKGLIHQFIVMQHSQVGFSQFQLLTENPLRYKAEEHYQMRFLQLAGNSSFHYLNTLEGRFSPQSTVADNKVLIDRIMKGFSQAVQTNSALERTQLSLIAHFIKRPETPLTKRQFIRHRFLRNELKQKTLALLPFIKHQRYGRLIQGVDAAANEMDAGPEVFAHTFRYLREKGVKHFTYHVGEDFRHLLSGLRAIIEAVEFLELHPGDRLGHCTAIGISPQLWYNRTGNCCFLPQGEWLDDLVFAWGLIKESGNPVLQSLIQPLESDIAKYSFEVYRHGPYPPYQLEEAWRFRKYDPMLYIEHESPVLPADDWNLIYLNDMEQIKDKFCQPYMKDIMERYHAPLEELKECMGQCPEKNMPKQVYCRYQYDRLISIKTCEIIPVELLEELQNIVLEKLARKGIVIESLPTSNLHISHYRELDEYHLKRWMDTTNSTCLLPPIVLGTDDPGIFMTNIYNEYARVYLYLEKKKYSVSDRMAKLQELYRCSDVYKFAL